jgi:hypothetical protein
VEVVIVFVGDTVGVIIEDDVVEVRQINQRHLIEEADGRNLASAAA